MKARPRTATVRLNAGQARLILAGLAQQRARVQVPADVDQLAEVVAEVVPEHEHTLSHYRRLAAEAVTD